MAGRDSDYGRFWRKILQEPDCKCGESKSDDTSEVIYALGIPGIGLANAKVICREFSGDVDLMIHATAEELAEIQGVGEVLAGAFVTYFQDEKHVESLKRLIAELEIPRKKNQRVNRSLPE